MPFVQHPVDPLATSMTAGGDMLPRALAEPPADVSQMLARHGCALPHYLDVQRLRRLAHACERWPTLRAQPSAASEPA